MSVATAADGKALLRAVLDEPDEDAHRLVYADWLEDDGQAERAEFVRAQIESARRGGECLKRPTATPDATPLPTCCRVCDLRRRERELLLHSPRPGITTYAWRGWGGVACGLVPEGARFDDHLTFRRGFVEAVRCDLASWLAHGPAAVLAHPVTSLTVTGKRAGHEEDDRWHWYAGTSDYPDCVAPSVLDLMTGFVNGDALAYEKSYLTEADAADALNAAALLWAQRKAGLKP